MKTNFRIKITYVGISILSWFNLNAFVCCFNLIKYNLPALQRPAIASENSSLLIKHAYQCRKNKWLNKLNQLTKQRQQQRCWMLWDQQFNMKAQASNSFMFSFVSFVKQIIIEITIKYFIRQKLSNKKRHFTLYFLSVAKNTTCRFQKGITSLSTATIHLAIFKSSKTQFRSLQSR